MLVVNFSHPLTPQQFTQLRELTRSTIDREIHRMAQFDDGLPFAPQARTLVDSVGLSSHQWQTEQLLLVPPALAPIACCVLCELHGRTGYFLPVVRLRPVANRVPAVFEIAEVVDLQGIRSSARLQRGEQA